MQTNEYCLLPHSAIQEMDPGPKYKAKIVKLLGKRKVKKKPL